MPSRVSVPIRIVTDRAALAAGEPVADSVARALSTVLDHAAREVPGVRRGARVELDGVDITWSGADLDALDAADRAWAEAVVQRAVERSFARFERSRPPRRLPLSDPVTELVDPARWDPLFALYEVPSYQDKGRPVKLRAHLRDDLFEQRQVVAWTTQIEEIADADLRRCGASTSASRANWPPPQVGTWHGLVWPVFDGYHFWFARPGTTEFRGIKVRLQPRREVQNGAFVDVAATEPTPGVAIMRNLVRFTTNGLEERVRFVREYLAPGIRRQLEEDARKGKFSEADIARFVPPKVEQEMAYRAKGMLGAGGVNGLAWSGRNDIAIYQAGGDELVASGTATQSACPSRGVGASASDATSRRARAAAIPDRRGRLLRARGQGGAVQAPGAGRDRTPGTGPRAGQAGAGTAAGAGAVAGTGAGARGAGRDGGAGTAVERGGTFPHGRGRPEEADLCEPYRDEPSLADFDPGDAADIRVLIDEIARILTIDPCDYPARFCINAAKKIGKRAKDTVDMAAYFDARLTGAPDGNGNLGTLSFTAERSAAIEFLRRAASAVPRISDLSYLVRQIYQDNDDWFGGRSDYAGLYGWDMRFVLDLASELRDSIGTMFGHACRVLMLQLLRASAAEIADRQNRIDLGAQIFYIAIMPQLEPVAALIRLRDRLKGEAIRKFYAEVQPGNPIFGAVGLIGEEAGLIKRYEAPPDIVMTGDDITGIRDAHGKEWNLKELDDMIAMRRGLTEEVEPLLKHVEDIPGLVDSMRHGLDATKRELLALLKKMADKNVDITRDVANDWEFAFKLARIDHGLPPGDAPGIEFVLQGIHLMAHQELVDAFEGDWHYADGVNDLFRGERVKGILKSIAELGVLVVASVLCPPLGVGLEIAVAGAHLLEAHERYKVLDALMHPELVVSRAQLEMELFAAELGFVLSIVPAIPGIPGMARAAFKIGAEVVEEGVAAGTQLVVDLFADAAMEAFEIALKRGLARAIVTEWIKFELMGKVMEYALAPIMEAKEEDIMRSAPVGGMDGIARLIALVPPRRATLMVRTADIEFESTLEGGGEGLRRGGLRRRRPDDADTAGPTRRARPRTWRGAGTVRATGQRDGRAGADATSRRRCFPSSTC